MSTKSKQISNPFSTGNGGGQFEAHVQTAFVVLMLAGGFAPCMPCWPIRKIKLQGKFAGYDTDDLIVFIEKPGAEEKNKILCQIKHTVNITENDKVFGEVIQAAWNDYNNLSLFSRGQDAIALITGPLCAKDISDTRTILEWARYSESGDDFFNRVERTNFSSQRKQIKLHAFKTQLTKANHGEPIPDDIFFNFLKHFHILGYDLDIKAGVTLSLLHSLIGQYSRDNAQSIWSRLLDEVQSANKNAGTINITDLPDDIQEAFKRKDYEVIPNKYSTSQVNKSSQDWDHFPHTSDMVIANLIGSWNEKNPVDIEIIQQLTHEDYDTWIIKIREVLQQPQSPIALRNGSWNVKERKKLWISLGSNLFDKTLDKYKQCVVTVLKENDPKFELLLEERFKASIYGKVLQNSREIRMGMAESLALLGSQPENLSNCSQNYPESIADLAVREILDNADWVLWGSLNFLLPDLAEAAPDEYLNLIDKALNQNPCPFDKLFSQEGQVITGENYLIGLLWSLEMLAWNEQFLVRSCILLGELANHDPGGRSANRPINSLTTILLPWFPQTTASIEKREVAVQTLIKEVPDIAWRLLLSLLPEAHQVSSHTYKPKWRNFIPTNWENSMTDAEYWKQVDFYSEMAVSLACDDLQKASDLVSHLGRLPEHSFNKFLETLSSNDFINKPESERLGIWELLTKFSLNNRRFSATNWALSSELVTKVEIVAAKLAPTNLLFMYQMLFSNRDYELYEENGNWEFQRNKIEERRQKAVKDILNSGGLHAIMELAEIVEAPASLGRTLGVISQSEYDTSILPELLGSAKTKLSQFASGYVESSQKQIGWNWADNLNITGWTLNQISQFLCSLPFSQETWDRVAAILGDNEREYWVNVNVNPYVAQGDLGIAVDKLINFGRPNAAIDCLSKLLFDKQPLDKQRCIKALLAAVSSKEPLYTIDRYDSTSLIKALQVDPETDPESLFQVEWVYLPMLDRSSGVYPIHLGNRLASDPYFFCEAIRLLYRSKKEKKIRRKSSEKDNSIAQNAWRLLDEWRTPPGLQPTGLFSGEQFMNWFEKVKKECTVSGHLEVALLHIGRVLFYCPSDPSGLWIDHSAANLLNANGCDEIRDGFISELYNSRGVHWIDASGKQELNLVEIYRKKADDVENAGYPRFAATLKQVAEFYYKEANRIIANKGENDVD